MEKAGFLDRIGRDNVCPHIAAALARSREILGLPPEVSSDPLREEKKKLETVRQELASAIGRIDQVLKPTNSDPGPAKP
jgi:SulP family sulfate permease